MNTIALMLVLASAVAHATWNLLAKRAINKEVFICLILVTTSGLLAPLALFLILKYPVPDPGWWFVLGTVILHVFYFIFLGRSYARADISLAYPIARGIGPALVPVLGIIVLKETIAPLAMVGIMAVIAGIFLVHSWGNFRESLTNPFKLLRESGGRYALLTGLVIAIYSIWDKMGVRYVDPFLYMYFLVSGSALLLLPYIWRIHGAAKIQTELKRRFKSIVLSGLLMFIAYGLILLALTFSKVSYISPAREVGIVVGVLFGALILREPFARGRLFGSCLIVLGLIFISLAH